MMDAQIRKYQDIGQHDARLAAINEIVEHRLRSNMYQSVRQVFEATIEQWLGYVKDAVDGADSNTVAILSVQLAHVAKQYRKYNELHKDPLTRTAETTS